VTAEPPAEPGTDARGAEGVQIGDHNTQINLWTHTPARSAYLRQVQLIAPPTLEDRAPELAELAEFCTAAGGSSYRWYRAAAWAGKSALLAWFVLHPPAGVRVVSFFVTARYPGHGDRVGFLDIVLEQLAELLDRSMPGHLTDATRGVHLMTMLDDAARACRTCGERLILVVDGLDEDRGVTIGANSYSIAALLPASPVAGMRVVVSARPHPPIPTDVPDDHPLRAPKPVLELTPSPHAQMVRVDAQRELMRLLHGTAVEHDLLGLLVAAGGGLTVRDLAELTECRLWLVEEHLRTATGRTFARRASRWRPGTAPDSYTLAHDKLHEAATSYLVGEALEDYRTRLHSWAERYRHRGWPDGTPEYLLHGYPGMLRVADDLTRMVALATDRSRYNRMLEVTGSDLAALDEITAAQDVMCDHPQPDLRALTRLAVHRDALVDRNAAIPTELPALWLDLGDPRYAVSLAEGITPAGRQRDALLLLIVRLAAKGRRDRAAELAARLDTLHVASRHEVKASAEDRHWQLALVRAASAIGHVDRAMAVIRSIDDRWLKIEALTVLADTSLSERQRVVVATEVHRTVNAADREEQWHLKSAVTRALAATGQVDMAEAAVTGDGLPWDRAEALWLLAQAATGPTRCAAIRDAATILAREVIDWSRSRLHRYSIAAISVLARSLAAVGDRHTAVALLRDVATLPREDPSTDLTPFVEVLVEVGDLEQAEHLARTASPPQQCAHSLAKVSVALATTGDHAHAAALARDAELMARAAGVRPTERSPALIAVARAHLSTGDRERAGALAHEVETSMRHNELRLTTSQTTALAAASAELDQDKWGELLVRRAGRGRAEALAAIARAITNRDPDRAHTAAQAIRNARLRTDVLLDIVRALARAGDLDRAERTAMSIRRGSRRSQALATVVESAATAGDLERCTRLVHLVTDSHWRARATAATAAALARAGERNRAEVLAHTISNPFPRAEALLELAQILLAAGNHAAASPLIAAAEHSANLTRDIELRTWMLIQIVQTVADAAGDPDQTTRLSDKAVELTAQLGSSAWESTVTTGHGMRFLVDAAIRTGNYQRAESLARAIKDDIDRCIALEDVITALVTSGQLDHATALARDIPTGFSFSRARALTHIATAMIAAGELHPAEALADDLPDLPAQAQFWSAITLTAPEKHAPRLAARALRTGRWHTILTALSTADPTTLATILYEYQINPRPTKGQHRRADSVGLSNDA
jgi:hypothetical protein